MPYALGSRRTLIVPGSTLICRQVAASWGHRKRAEARERAGANFFARHGLTDESILPAGSCILWPGPTSAREFVCEPFHASSLLIVHSGASIRRRGARMPDAAGRRVEALLRGRRPGHRRRGVERPALRPRVCRRVFSGSRRRVSRQRASVLISTQLRSWPGKRWSGKGAFGCVNGGGGGGSKHRSEGVTERVSDRTGCRAEDGKGGLPCGGACSCFFFWSVAIKS